MDDNLRICNREGWGSITDVNTTGGRGTIRFIIDPDIMKDDKKMRRLHHHGVTHDLLEEALRKPCDIPVCFI